MTFIFIFLPLVLTIYFCAKKSWRNHILLFASFVFYAWGEPKYLAIMLLTILINYVGAICLERVQYSVAKKKLVLFATVVADLSILAYFKYFNFICENINSVFAMDIKFIDVIMPIGISFYTFQAMSYILDVYRGEIKAQKSISNLALYIALFPPLVAGPIVKYCDVATQLVEREEKFDDIVNSLTLKDPYMVLADFADYDRAQQKLFEIYNHVSCQLSYHQYLALFV